jgi:hypothetical protein
MDADLAQRCIEWLKGMMVDGEYDKRNCCWTDTNRGHRKDCELKALLAELKQRTTPNTGTGP